MKLINNSKNTVRLINSSKNKLNSKINWLYNLFPNATLERERERERESWHEKMQSNKRQRMLAAPTHLKFKFIKKKINIS